MNKFFKSVAAVSLAMFAVACSSDKVLDVNSESETVEGGVDFTIMVDGGTSNQSRLSYDLDDVTVEKTPYTWSLSDSIYVIGDNGKYIGTVYCTEAGKGATGQVGKFVGKNLKVQDGEKVHLWFFGGAQTPLYAGTAMYDDRIVPAAKKIFPSSIKSGMVTVDNTYQYLKELSINRPEYATHSQPVPAKYAEVLCKSAVITVTDDGKAIAKDYVTKSDEILMKHLTSVLSVKFDREFFVGVTVEGCYNKATFNLVDETVTPLSKNTITVYNNTGAESYDKLDIVLFPGMQAPTFTFADKNDFVFSGDFGSMKVNSGIHYMEYSQGAANNYGIPVNTEVDFDKSKVVTYPYEINDKGDQIFFGAGNLYATGTEYPARVNQAGKQYYLNPKANVKDDGSTHDYNWPFMDMATTPLNVYKNYPTNPDNSHAVTLSGTIANNDPYSPGYIYTCQSAASGYYRLPKVEEINYILDHYFWAWVELTDVTDPYTGKHPQGILITPLNKKKGSLVIALLASKWSLKVKKGGLSEAWLLSVRENCLKYCVENITKQELWQLTGLHNDAILDGTSVETKAVQLDSSILEPTRLIGTDNNQATPIFLPINVSYSGYLADTYYMTNRVGSGSVESWKFVSNVSVPGLGWGSIGASPVPGTYNLNFIRLVRDAK